MLKRRSHADTIAAIVIGARVRSYDFEFEFEFETNESYFEGVVVDVDPDEGLFTMRIERRVLIYDGKEMNSRWCDQNRVWYLTCIMPGCLIPEWEERDRIVEVGGPMSILHRMAVASKLFSFFDVQWVAETWKGRYEYDTVREQVMAGIDEIVGDGSDSDIYAVY